MLRKGKKKASSDDPTLSPDTSSASEALASEAVDVPRHRSRVWLWVLLGALAVFLLIVFIVILGVRGVYDGLRDRAIASRSAAQEHQVLGLAHMEAGDYDLAIAELELAMRYDANLPGLRERLQESRDLARAQLTPTSETRRDAAALLYRQAVPYYENGDLVQSVAVLEELRGLDADYQRENVETMLVTAYHRMGLNAVQQNLTEDAREYFEAVLAIRPDDQESQKQLHLLGLYEAALDNWERDWPVVIQTLEDLYSLDPNYKDVQVRLHSAHVAVAQEYAAEGNWCQAAEVYASAVEVFPLEATVGWRDDARINCQATAEAPTPTVTVRVTARPTRELTPTPNVAPASTSTPVAVGGGRIAFTRYDAARQQFDLHTLDVSSGDDELLRQNGSQPAFHPNGRQLVFRNHDPSRLGLGILEVGKSEVKETTDHAEDATPAWSAPAQQIVFASNKHGDRKWRIYAISPGQVRGEGEEWAFGQMPAWSPEGSQVVYHGCDERGDNCGVRIINAGGVDPQRLTTDPSDTAPSWSPTGAQVAFISARGGNWDLFLVDVATRQELRLTDLPSMEVAPAWSPDGAQLAFLSNRGGPWAVYILELTSGQIRKVVETGDAPPDSVTQRLSWVR